jgi:hypothetical protein
MKKISLFAILLVILLFAACTTTGTKEDSGKPKTIIKLEAKDSELIPGDGSKLETDGINIGWWESTEDQIKWSLDIENEGEYTVLAFFSCPEEFAGSEVDVTINEQTSTFKVFSTGDWESFMFVEIGKYNLTAGQHTMLIQAVTIPDRFVCNIKYVRVQK